MRQRNQGSLKPLTSKLSTREIRDAIDTLLNQVKNKKHIVLRSATNVDFPYKKIELLAFKQFREEYESYLDYLLGDDSLLMTQKLERIDKKYTMKSILRVMADDKTSTATVNNEFMISKREILKDKLLIELIENPKKLWKHLSIKVRNTWINRIIVSKRFKTKLGNIEELLTLEGDQFKDRFTEEISKLVIRGTYWEILKRFLLSEANNCKNWATLCRTLKSLEKNAFKTYFYSFFAVSEVKNSSGKKDKESTSNKKGRVKMRSLDEF